MTNAVAWAAIVERLGAAMKAPAIAPGARDALARWLALLARWKDKTDLTGAKTPEAMVEVMVADAFVLATMAPPDASVIDVGAGAGGPAIPLALLREDVRLTMVEPRVRRVAFLRTSVGALGLVDRARVVAASIDVDRPVVPDDTFSPVTMSLSRATFAPAVWMSIGLALAPGAIVLATEPIAPVDAETSLHQEQWYRWPFSDAPRWAGHFTRRGERDGANDEGGRG